MGPLDDVDAVGRHACHPKYELFGVVSHIGNLRGGHYVAYVKCQGCWYLADDPWILKVEEEVVARCQAYMLFYCQQDLLVGINSRFNP